MIFKSFTWQQFLIAALVLSSLWYLVILPLLYRKQIRQWLDGKKNVEPLRKAWEEELEEPAPAETEEDDLIGKSKMPEGMSRLSMNMFGFAPDADDDASRERQQSLVPDAIEELKSIFHILEKEQGTKDDFISLFVLIKAKYAAIRYTPSEQALNDYIRENALFPISDDELANLWN